MPTKPPDPGRSEIEHELRFSLVSQVHALLKLGFALAAAVVEVAARTHLLLDGTYRQVSERTVYRYVALYARDGYRALAPRGREHIATSVILDETFLRFLIQEKTCDPDASIPEVIRRAQQDGVLANAGDVDRSTVYRVARRMGLSVRRSAAAAESGQDVRRFSYPHRMQMVLCDGKHFRVGPTRARRVALIFLDDHSRMALHCVVGTSECADLFLRGLYELICEVGLADIYYVDNGPGFIALDSIDLVRSLGRLLVHGRKRYPEGRGKIEAFNKTLKRDVLRLWARPDSPVEPDCAALELRLRHYLAHDYNVRPHESLDGLTPAEVFDSDERELVFPDLDPQALRDSFVVYETRTVSADNVISFDSVAYEVPAGHARTEIRIHRRLLDGGSLWLLHREGLVRLHPVDLALNARDRRGDGTTPPAETDQLGELPRSAADRAFERDHGSIVTQDGDCPPAIDDRHDDPPFFQES